MNVPFLQAVIFLLIGIVIIIVLTARYHVHAFFALMIACFVTGLGVHLSLPAIITATKDGFGNVMKSLGLIIVLGTTLGALLEHTGSTKVMANYILKKVGERNASLAISLTGFVVGLPVFCDSGYIVLSGLNTSLARRTRTSAVIMSVSLASGLYSVHCLIPPHPGATAAATTLGVDFGRLMLYGIIIAIPAMLVGHWWSLYMGKKLKHVRAEEEEMPEDVSIHPPVIRAFLPVLVPVVLIALRSFFVAYIPANTWTDNLLALGDPVLALAIGVLLAFNVKRKWTKKDINALLHDAIEKAGSILIIIGAGGAFGAVLAAINIGAGLGQSPVLRGMGIVFPFLITFILKTAQGSSTVAIITAAAIVQPLLATLGLNSSNGILLCVLAMGAGSMMISHANDAYFWVIAKFSGLDVNTMLKVYSVATIWMGLITFVMVYVLSVIIH
ncbi:MAG TPA: GntP family permease [Chitinophagaceae bacterium]|nr:GntP family permease [Chitinophagaceae bacterium]